MEALANSKLNTADIADRMYLFVTIFFWGQISRLKLLLDAKLLIIQSLNSS